ncbi:MAG TPA: hypothetical protein VF475_18330 [Sphingobium sp.]
MKPAILGIGSAAAGAVVAVALMHSVPAFAPGGGDTAAEADPVAATNDEGVVKLDRAGIAHADIRLVTLAPAQVATQRSGFARALDISALSAIESEIQSAQAALSASQADFARQRALAAEDQSAATKAVEAARAQAAADRARLTAAQRRVALEFGPGLAGFTGSALTQLVRAIAAGEASLVRVDFPDGPAPVGAQVRIAGTMAQLLGPAAATDARLQTAGSLAVVRGPLARQIGAGRVLPVTLAAASGSEGGVIVPRDAILRFQGGLWVYRAVAGGGFARIELIDARPEDKGWFVRTGVKPGDAVAVGGIGVLLSLERGGPVEEDE